MDENAPTPSHTPGSARRRNPRGQGERLREQIISAATRLLDELADDKALSMRAVARETGVAATSVYLHFADRDALVTTVMERSFSRLMRAVERAESAAGDPAAELRARVLAHGHWARRHFGLYKVLHESTLNLREELPFMRRARVETVAAIQRCMDAGLAPAGDAQEAALDLRTAMHGMILMRIDQPHVPLPPLEEQVDRFLTKLVGIRT